MYLFGALVLAKPLEHLAEQVQGRFARAVYLCPEVGSGNHIVQYKLLDGSLKVGRASKIRMLVPVTYELGTRAAATSNTGSKGSTRCD